MTLHTQRADALVSTSPFAGAEVISTYTRAQAIEDGELVDVTETAREAGFRIPVAVARGAWADCVAWTDADNRRKGTVQDEAGRLWDVLWKAFLVARRAPGRNRVRFQVYRVPVAGRGRKPRLTELVLHIGPGDCAEPVITIMGAGDE